MNAINSIGSIFKRVLPMSAQMLAKRFDVIVRFGTRAKTDGKIIWLPTLPIEACVDTCNMVMGHMVHEVGHILYTDFPTYRNGAESLGALFGNTKLASSLLNSVEDPRIEADIINAYGGAAQYISETKRILSERGLIKKPDTPANAMSLYCLLKGNQILGAYSIYESDEKIAECITVLEDFIGEDGLFRLNALLEAEFPQLRSTQNAVELTNDILALIKEIDEEQQEEQNKQNQQQNQSQDEGEGDSQPQSQSGTGDDDGGEDESDASNGSGQSGDDDSEQSDDANGENQGGNGSTKGASEIFDDEDVVEKVIDLEKAMSEQVENEIEAQADKGTLETTESTQICKVGVTGCTPNLPKYQQLKDLASESVGVIQRKLDTFLALERQPSFRGGSKGKLNPRKLHRATQGDLNVFRKRIPQQNRTTAVTALVDTSSSMSEEDLDNAFSSAIALAEACNRASIACEIYGFDSELVKLKSFDEPLVKARGTIGAFKQFAGGGTDMGAAMYEAGISMFDRDEQRKLFMVITDGHPNDGVLVERMVTYLTKANVEVFGLGIGCNSVQRYFPSWAVVQEPREIGMAVITAFNKALRKAA